MTDRELSPLERVERDEFSRGHIAPGEPPVEPRPAATIVLAHASAGNPYEVLLLRRPDTSRFAAGAYVFPGGVIDPADADPRLLPVLPAGTAEPAALTAALRELFEETGILPADTSVEPARLREARAGLLADRIDFASLVAQLEVGFTTLDAHYFARWITPARLSRRYDTRFFLTVQTRSESDPELTREHTGFLWISPQHALERFHEGALRMLFPTLKTLEELAGFRTLEEAIEELSDRDVEPIHARLLIRGDKIWPVMPGDPEYDTAE
jgi:8-oxo-dGTP pyrophosphatase MutT (NUDIX family)